MWTDAAGVAHTVSLPDPTDVMTEDFRAGLDALAQFDPEGLQVVVNQAQEQFFDAGCLELSASADYVGAAPPKELLRGHVLTAKDVANAIDHTDLRWRVDVIMALDEYLT